MNISSQSSSIFHNSEVFADVILPFPLQNTFTYKVPHHLSQITQVGVRVVVPFGKKKIYSGIVRKLHTIQPEVYKAKDILDVLDEKPIFSEPHFRFWEWIAGYYCCTIGEVMSAALPANLKLASETCVMVHPDFTGEVDELTNDEFIIANALTGKDWLSLQEVEQLVERKNIFPLINSLLRKEVIFLKENIRQKYTPKFTSCIELHQELKNEGPLKQVFSDLEKFPKQLNMLLTFLMLEKEKAIVEKKELLKKAEVTDAVLQSLVKKNILRPVNVPTDRIQFSVLEKKEFNLSEAQRKSFSEIKEGFKNHLAILFHGITGSGKTNIYIKLIEEVINQGKQVLYLVPEISLTAQLITRLRSYFGDNTGIYHSRYSDNERAETLFKLLNNEYQLMLGSRSSIFLPFTNLGLIIVDEEHELSYKQSEPSPRYHARDAALVLSHQQKIPVLLGTATPSFESFFNSRKGKYGYVELNQRYGEIKPPRIHIVDLVAARKQTLLKGSFSQQLLSDMKKTIGEKKQVILFLNRRGYSPSLECRSCGWSPNCEHCDISLTYHKAANVLRCHYCGFQQRVLVKCKACNTSPLFMRGSGTERIEDELPVFFPEATTFRLDFDSTRRKMALQKIIEAFEKGEADILVGTQMVTKGLDFEKVKLIGIVNADQMLHYPDFRANERSFQMMLQVSGRAGRKHEQGEVIIQTWSHQHPIFMHIINNDFLSFYKEEMLERSNYHYPPFTKLIKISLKHKEFKTCALAAGKLADILKNNFSHRVLGPEAPPVPRVRNKYIMNILLKFERNNSSINEAKAFILAESETLKQDKALRSVQIIIDVDPY